MRSRPFASLASLASLAVLTICAAFPALAAEPTCQATSTAVAPTVVELYTSEGCSSCPPADRWLSTLKGRPDVLALAFHVNYWDRLGWTDRFATPEATARQHELAAAAGSRQVYTPQVIANGRDWRTWPKLPATAPTLPARSTPAAVAVTLARDGELVTVQVKAAPTAPALLSGYWAVLEDQHQSKVRAGENAGQTLRHDHVVRLYKPLPAWSSASSHRALLSVSRGAVETPRRVVFVVTDAVTHRPLQALALAC